MRLDHRGWTLVLDPDLGGSITALRHEGRDILRPASPGAETPLDTACFPLVPYANRIADGAFAWAGEAHRVPRNFGEHPHSLHGVGWQRRWTAEHVGSGTIVLSHAHDGGAGWPWPYRAEQRITLAASVATIALTATNLAGSAAPMGLGLHPYFPCDAATRLRADAERLWLSDNTQLPTTPTHAALFGDWSAGAPVQGSGLIDHSYDGWDGSAIIEQRWGCVRLAAVGASAFHLYRPPGGDAFCFEPVRNLPDAINRGGMPVVDGAGTVALELTIAV